MSNARLFGLVASLAAAALALTACSAGGGATNTSSAGTVALVIPGTSGDGGFFDQSIQGVKAGADESGWTSQVVEAGYEPTKWEPALNDLASGTDNLVITGSFAMVDLVTQAAAQYPDKQFVIFDSEVDQPNVYSITYRYDETGFLAGALAGLLEKSTGVERINGSGVVGVVGGQDIPVINEYIDGFKKGVAAVAPDVKVLSAYAGSFSDPVKGKAVADDMINQGAEIVFSAAGATDAGVFEAAADRSVWALGNAAAQANSGATVNGVDAVLTASDTNVVTSLEDAVKKAAAGQLPVGTTQNFGVKDGSVSIIDSSIYERVVPQPIRDQMTQITSDVAAGKYEDVLTGK